MFSTGERQEVQGRWTLNRRCNSLHKGERGAGQATHAKSQRGLAVTVRVEVWGSGRLHAAARMGLSTVHEFRKQFAVVHVFRWKLVPGNGTLRRCLRSSTSRSARIWATAPLT
jgi:hypothetical protein